MLGIRTQHVECHPASEFAEFNKQKRVFCLPFEIRTPSNVLGMLDANLKQNT